MPDLRENVRVTRGYIHRCIVRYKNGNFGTGSGFFISKAGLFLTCFHVAFGELLKTIRDIPYFPTLSGADEHSKLLSFYNNVIDRTEVEFFDGSFRRAELKQFDEKHDLAILDVADGSGVNVCKIDWDYVLDYGEQVFFGGYPTNHDYPPDKGPFAVSEGIVSSFVESTVGGDRYEHVLINSIALGGHSGSPLFNKGNVVVGFVNGLMNWGRDDLICQQASGAGYTKTSLRTPLGITYVTPMKTIKGIVLA